MSIRETLSANIKKHRETHGLTQEKLAEKAGLSANMVNDIEGCRTWISDKTLLSLAEALKVETYRLFVPLTTADNEVTKTVVKDLAQNIQKINKDLSASFKTALKQMGVKG